MNKYRYVEEKIKVDGKQMLFPFLIDEGNNTKISGPVQINAALKRMQGEVLSNVSMEQIDEFISAIVAILVTDGVIGFDKEVLQNLQYFLVDLLVQKEDML